MLNSPMFQNLSSLICFIPLFYVIIIETSSLILLFPFIRQKQKSKGGTLSWWGSHFFHIFWHFIDQWLSGSSINNQVAVPALVTKEAEHIDNHQFCVRIIDSCHMSLCADYDPWPCWMPQGPGLYHLSTWCGWQSVYPAGPLKPYFQPVTCTDGKPGSLSAFQSQAIWHIVQPTVSYRYTLMSALECTKSAYMEAFQHN